MSIGVPGVSSAEKIGQGGFGVVYRALQDSFDRTVAVKVLSNMDLDAEAHERFAREVRAIGRLSGHPNIVSVYEHGTTESGAPYLLMEFCERGSYGDALRSGHRLSWDRTLDVGISIAEALDATHQSRLLHRDVKPDNILIDRFGKPKLADFGIAKDPAQSGLTVTNGFVGSAEYIAPEIVLGQDPSPASDLYALAASMYALITGGAPYARKSDTSMVPLLHRIASEQPPSLHHRDVPTAVADAVLHGMAKEPAHRPASCAVFAAELRRAKQLAEEENATRATPIGSGYPAGAPGDGATPPGSYGVAPPGVTPPGGTVGPSYYQSNPNMPASNPHVPASNPHVPVGNYTSGNIPAQPGNRAGRLVPVLIAIGGAVFLLGLIGILVVVLTGAKSPATGQPDPSVVTAPDPGARSDGAAADALRLTAASADALGGPSWLPAANNNSVNANGAFCGEQLTAGPSRFSQLELTSADGAQYPLLDTAGAVFDSAEAAATYQQQRNASAACGTWTVGTDTLDVFEPPIAPQLVGCACQDVAVHEVVVTAADGSQATQYMVLAQQDRYISAAFYTVAGTANDNDIAFIGDLIDAVVAQVNDVATGAGE